MSLMTKTQLPLKDKAGPSLNTFRGSLVPTKDGVMNFKMLSIFLKHLGTVVLSKCYLKHTYFVLLFGDYFQLRINPHLVL